MTDEAVNTEDLGEDDEVAPSGKKKFLIMGVALLLLVGGGAGAYFVLDPFGGPTVSVDGESEQALAEPEEVVFYPMPAITVNLENIAGRQQYLKLRATLELRNESEIAAIEPYMPRVLDAFQVYLRELRTTDLEGSAGLFRLKEELQRRINTAVYPVKVRKILFEEILIQ